MLNRLSEELGVEEVKRLLYISLGILMLVYAQVDTPIL